MIRTLFILFSLLAANSVAEKTEGTVDNSQKMSQMKLLSTMAKMADLLDDAVTSSDAVSGEEIEADDKDTWTMNKLPKEILKMEQSRQAKEKLKSEKKAVMEKLGSLGIKVQKMTNSESSKPMSEMKLQKMQSKTLSKAGDVPKKYMECIGEECLHDDMLDLEESADYEDPEDVELTSLQASEGNILLQQVSPSKLVAKYFPVLYSVVVDGSHVMIGEYFDLSGNLVKLPKTAEDEEQLVTFEFASDYIVDADELATNDIADSEHSSKDSDDDGNLLVLDADTDGILIHENTGKILRVGEEEEQQTDRQKRSYYPRHSRRHRYPYNRYNRYPYYSYPSYSGGRRHIYRPLVRRSRPYYRHGALRHRRY